jgi:hypothetical protein
MLSSSQLVSSAQGDPEQVLGNMICNVLAGIEAVLIDAQ